MPNKYSNQKKQDYLLKKQNIFRVLTKSATNVHLLTSIFVLAFFCDFFGLGLEELM